MRSSSLTRPIAAASIALALGGCASFSPDGGFDRVKRLVGERGGAQPTWLRTDDDVASVQANVAALLAKPLGVDDAVKLALLNNRSLQAAYAELGIAEADLVQAGRVPNPTLSFTRLRGSDGLEIDRQLMLPIVGLLTMPQARKIEQRRFEAAQLRAAAEALRIADETRRAWFAAVAARQTADYMEQVKVAAEAGAELAQRMAAAGNWSKLQQAREQAFLADAIAQVTRAKQQHIAQRETLVRLLGLSGAQLAFTLPDKLPELPAQARTIQDAERDALANRLDLLAAQQDLSSLAATLGLTRATRFVNALDIGAERNTGPDAASHARGYVIEWQIPLFDWGQARTAKAESMYMQAVHRAAALAVDARSQVRQSYASYALSYSLARHYQDSVVPLKKQITDEQLLRYNGMLISVFELLADAREQTTSVNASIEALRDFWIADATLSAAMTGANSAPERTIP